MTSQEPNMGEQDPVADAIAYATTVATLSGAVAKAVRTFRVPAGAFAAAVRAFPVPVKGRDDA